MTTLVILATLLGSVIIVALSRHLSRSDDTRDFTPPSFIAIGDEP